MAGEQCTGVIHSRLRFRAAKRQLNQGWWVVRTRPTIIEIYAVLAIKLSMKDLVSRFISWILVIDLGVVLASFAWFLAAVVGQSMNLNLGLNLWYSLWNPLILPAISILMAGAIASGIVGWLGRRFGVDPS